MWGSEEIFCFCVLGLFVVCFLFLFLVVWGCWISIFTFLRFCVLFGKGFCEFYFLGF